MFSYDSHSKHRFFDKTTPMSMACVFRELQIGYFVTTYITFCPIRFEGLIKSQFRVIFQMYVYNSIKYFLNKL
jgi:hypothetical protein